MSRRTGSRPTQIIFLTIFLLLLSAVASADYLTLKGDNQRTANLSGTGPNEPNLIWSASITGHGYIGAAAAISQNRIFVSNWPDMTFKGELGLACLDKTDGHVLWLNSLDGKGGASTPAINGSRVFIGSLTGDLFCVDTQTGNTIWNKTIETDPRWWGVASSPLIQDAMVYIISFSKGTVHAINLDGEEQWNLSTGEVSPYLSVACSGQRLILPGGDPAIYCLNASTGVIIWKAPVSSQITATPAIGENRVFAVLQDGIVCLDVESGKQIWNREINGTISSPAIAQGRVFVGSDDTPIGHLSCYDAANGSTIYSEEVNGPVKSSPLILDGLVYFGTSCEDGRAYALYANNGSIAWSYPVGAYIMSTASASDRVAYIGADDGRLYAFGSAPGGLLWKGEVQLTNGSINLTASSGNEYRINESTALGALITACKQSNSSIGSSINISDSLYDLYGLQVKSLGGYEASGDMSWRFWINYPQEAMPALAPDITDLHDEETVIFYFGDRRARPDDSPRLEITARTFLKRPEALFLTVSNHPQILQASASSVLNVTLKSPRNSSNLSSYDLIFIEMIGSEATPLLEKPLQKAKEKGVPILVLNSEGYESLGNVNLSDHPFIQQYWDSGLTENMKRLFSYLAADFCGLNVDVKDPLPMPEEYIYHPDSPDLFMNISSYLSWYSQKNGYKYNNSAPTIGIISYYQDLGNSDRAALIRALEESGANAIDLGLSSSSSLHNFFLTNNISVNTSINTSTNISINTSINTSSNTSIVDAAILTKSFRLNYGDPDQGIEDLQEMNVPVMRGIRLYYQTPDEWKNSTGMNPMEIYFQIAQPEMDGVIEPIVMSARTDRGYQPISSQMNWLAERALGWAKLKKINDSEKKVAIIYYNHGGGKDNIEGCYINVPRSLQNILDALKAAGYRVNGTVPDEKVLIDLLAHQGTNVGSWAPGELQAMVAAGNATLLPAEVYEQWFEALPQDRQSEVTKMWGQPPGKIMVYENQSGKYLVIPKISFGNVLLLPQPSRGWLENSTVLYHDRSVPPHHQYIAFYLWLKHGFGADSVIHLGKHGTQEWLAGKECGIASDDWPALLIEDLPVVYPYIVDNIAEGTQAKRRGDAVMITHLTPPIVASGLYGNLTNLAETVFQYKSVDNASVKETYKNQIINISRQMHLDEDLDVNLTNISGSDKDFEIFAGKLQNYLYELKSQFMPYGLHTFGKPPQGEPLIGLLTSMLGDKFKREVAAMISYDDYPNRARMDKEKELDLCCRNLIMEIIVNGTDRQAAEKKVFGDASSNLANSANRSGSANLSYSSNLSDSVNLSYSSNLSDSANLSYSSNLSDILNLSQDYNAKIASCSAEISGLLKGLNSSYIQPSPADDPIRDPEVLPTGRNFRSMDPRRIPTSAAWTVGCDLADRLIENYRQDHNDTFPRKMAIILWAWAMTDHGVVESEILRLIGAEPVYDAYGGVSDVRLIPLSELGRPRIDVVVVPSGLHRDLFPEKLKLIDRAIRLAANDTSTEYPNYIRENSESIYQYLIASGNVSHEDAVILSASRIFLEEAGTYGPNLDSPISASDTWDDDSKLGRLFIDRMSYIYGDGIWSSKLSSGKDLSVLQKGLFESNLAEVQAAAHHTNSNLYGFIDNDDVFQYLGGISLAVRTVTGKAPDMYVTDAVDPDKSRVSSLHDYFSRELRSRYYNPRWIKGMMEQGYSGAREMDKLTEYLWGWETTVPDLVSENTWNEVHDIYVDDKYQMGLKEFFDDNSPWASQALAGRLLETARKDRWHPSEETKKKLAERYEQSVQDYGVTCCHHTCGNLALQEYMQGVLASMDTASNSKSPAKSDRSSTSTSQHHGSKSKKTTTAHNQTKTAGFGSETASAPKPSDSSGDEVQGYVMEAVETKSQAPGQSSAPALGIGLVVMVLFAIWMGYRQRQ